MQASSLLLVSRLNCSITTSDGRRSVLQYRQRLRRQAADDIQHWGRGPLAARRNVGRADRSDRILLAVCAAIWLAALGAAVAATVALVDLGRGHPESSTTSGTPWLLYTVIGVSALVIVGAIPLLMRARRAALAIRGPAVATGAAGRPPQRPRLRRGVLSRRRSKLRSYRPGRPDPPRSG